VLILSTLVDKCSMSFCSSSVCGDGWVILLLYHAYHKAKPLLAVTGGAPDDSKVVS
jgi:hypothetical protein